MNIVVVGTGYVGLSNAVLLAQHYHVTAIDVIADKVNLINQRISPIVDRDLTHYLKNVELDLQASLNGKDVYPSADYIIISTPTNYDEETQFFDTSSIEKVLEDIIVSGSQATIIIKSTVPVGYTETLVEKTGYSKIIFSPEFLREGKALYDNLYPSRIILGLSYAFPKNELDKAQEFIEMLKDSAIKEDIPTKIMASTEAEAVKLFANTYLAMRVSFFNELDTYAIEKNLNPKSIIDCICLDPRIGDYYNNPSFGYGGYCLPKDTKQLLANFANIPNNLISATVTANETRKKFIANQILELDADVIGIYRLIMKAGSYNFRESSILDIIEQLHKAGKEIIIYEPSISAETFNHHKIVNDLELFKKSSNIILANRKHPDIADVADKVFTRDIFADN